MKRVKVKINGKEKEAVVVDNVKEKKRVRNIKGQEYTWVEYYAYVYIPKGFVGKKLVLVPLD